MLETITDIRYIQKLPGHKSSKNNRDLYTSINKMFTKYKAPFDDL
jgi:hypothetical protein